MARKQKKKRWSIQDRMSLLIFFLMSGTLVFCVGLGIYQTVEKATNSGELNISFEEYEKEELALDSSTENVLYEKTTEEPDVIVEEQPAKDEEENKFDRTDEVEIPDVDYPYYIKVNRQENCVTVYTLDDNDEYTVPVKAMVCSVGLNNNTPIGVFQTSTKYTWRELFGNVYGQYAYRIHNSIMFHSVPYFTPNKDDLETEEYNKLGEAASLGCVRLAVVDAKWLVDNCPEGTTVEIYDDDDPGPLGKPEALTIDVASENAGWDPTDPDKKNPWKTAGSALAEETETEMDLAAAGQQKTDTGSGTGNSTDPAESSEGQSPSLTGVENQTIERGESVDLLKGVSAVDADGNVLTVQTSGTADTSKVGAYEITYTATDHKGNSTTDSAWIYVEDTVAPVVTVQTPIVLTGITRDQLYTKLFRYITATDGKEVLDASHLTIACSELAEGIENDISVGIFNCSVYAMDDYGNRSETVEFEVTYQRKKSKEK